MSGLLERIFPRRNASGGSSGPAEHPRDQYGAGPSEAPPADSAEEARIAQGWDADASTDQTGVLAPLHGAADAPPEGQTAQMPAATDEPGAGQSALAGSGKPTDAGIPASPGFGARARLRRRLRYLRKLRELLLRDLGGFVFDQRRFGRSREDIVEAKAGQLAAIDGEIRALERTLDDHRLLELREPGVGGVCERCGSFFPSTASFCSECGAPVTARKSLADEAAEQPALPGAGPPLGAPTAEGPGGDLWSRSHAAHQVTPPEGFQPVDQVTPPEGFPAVDASPAEADAPPPPAAEAGNGTQAGEAGLSLPGGVQRPDDDAAEPPSLSSGDPLQQR